MNRLKDHCKNDGYKYFLTYADNNAIGYFKKQGFHKNLKMPMDQWKDYIKDYDGGTLMEAEIDPKFDYSNLSEILKEQKKCIAKYCKKFLNIKRKYSYSQIEEEANKKGIDLNYLKKKDKESKGSSEKEAKEKDVNDLGEIIKIATFNMQNTIDNFKTVSLDNYYAELSRIDGDTEKNAKIFDDLWETVVKDKNISEFN